MVPYSKNVPLKYMKQKLLTLFTLGALCVTASFRPPSHYEVALMKYQGGGDWYSNSSALYNLIDFCNRELGTDIDPNYEVVEAGSPELLNYPFVHMTGHGNVEWNGAERDNIRLWLRAGGFLHIDDNYGMDPYIRPQLNELFPESDLIEIAADHPIFKGPYLLEEGLPKIHEHDGGSPQAFGIFLGGRLVVLYTFESDLGDGWEDPEVHNDPPSIRTKALQMGANIIHYAFNGSVDVQNN